MQAAGMMRGTRTVYDLVLLLSISAAYVHTLPLQVLPSIPGFIPVYIRHGDQPLEEINPALAEAFHEGSSLSKNIDLESIPEFPDIDPEQDNGDKYRVYPLHVREADSGVSLEDGRGAETGAAKAEAGEEEVRKEISKSLLKVNPLTDEERNTLERLKVEVNEDERKSNNMYNSNFNIPKLTSDEQTLDPVTKIDQPVHTDSVRPDSHPIEDVSRLSVNENAETPASTREEEPVTEQSPSKVLSNFQKVHVPPETLPKSEKQRGEDETLAGK